MIILHQKVNANKKSLDFYSLSETVSYNNCNEFTCYICKDLIEILEMYFDKKKTNFYT